eukprot:387863_1
MATHVERIKQHKFLLQQLNEVDRTFGLNELLSIINNIFKNPFNPKFQRFNIRKLTSKFTKCKICIQILYDSGFTKSTNGKTIIFNINNMKMLSITNTILKSPINFNEFIIESGTIAVLPVNKYNIEQIQFGNCLKGKWNYIQTDEKRNIDSDDIHQYLFVHSSVINNSNYINDFLSYSEITQLDGLFKNESVNINDLVDIDESDKKYSITLNTLKQIKDNIFVDILQIISSFCYCSKSNNWITKNVFTSNINNCKYDSWLLHSTSICDYYSRKFALIDYKMVNKLKTNNICSSLSCYIENGYICKNMNIYSHYVCLAKLNPFTHKVVSILIVCRKDDDDDSDDEMPVLTEEDICAMEEVP